MTQTEAIKLAIEWIEKQPEETTHTKYDVDTRYVVLRELEAALAQPEQEPVAYCWKSLSTGDLFDFVENKNGDELKEQDEDLLGSNLVLLYTTPPQRTFVGLDPEEQSEMWDRAEKRQAYQGVPALAALIQEVEAKLKDKNL